MLSLKCHAGLLVSAKTFSEYLRAKKDDPAFIEKFERLITKEVDRINHIITHLLEFAKPGDTQTIEMVDLKAELDEVVDLLGSEMRLDDIEFTSDVKDIPKIIGNKKQVQEVLLNLIQNAIQSIENKGRIDVEARKKDGRVTLSIKDTGCGIPRDKLGQIFGPFFTARKDSKGVGMGLFIVRHIMNRLGGDIEVSSEENKGTTFTLAFQVAESRERVNA